MAFYENRIESLASMVRLSSEPVIRLWAESELRLALGATDDFPLAFISKAKAGVSFVLGFPKGGGGSEVQSVIFDKDYFTEDQARSWLSDNDLSASKVDETENSFRFRQQDPGKYDQFRTIKPGAPSDS